jgi:hypothetical protein
MFGQSGQSSGFGSSPVPPVPGPGQPPGASGTAYGPPGSSAGVGTPPDPYGNSLAAVFGQPAFGAAPAFSASGGAPGTSSGGPGGAAPPGASGGSSGSPRGTMPPTPFGGSGGSASHEKAPPAPQQKFMPGSNADLRERIRAKRGAGATSTSMGSEGFEKAGLGQQTTGLKPPQRG